MAAPDQACRGSMDAMRRLFLFTFLVAMASWPLAPAAFAQYAQRAQYEEMIAAHAKANLVPEDLVHRVIIRESKYQASLMGRGGAIGLMQIKLATARGLGYTGTAEGLRDPFTNLLYGIKYLAGAYRVANGDHNRAVHYYAAGYYMAAKRQRLDHLHQAKAGPTRALPEPIEKTAADASEKSTADASAGQAPR